MAEGVVGVGDGERLARRARPTIVHEAVARGAGEGVEGAGDGGAVLDFVRQLAVEGRVGREFSHSMDQYLNRIPQSNRCDVGSVMSSPWQSSDFLLGPEDHITTI